MKKIVGLSALVFLFLNLSAQTSPEIAPPPVPPPPAPAEPTLKTTPIPAPTPTIAPVPAPPAPPLVTPAPVAPQPVVTTVPVNESPRLGTGIVYNDKGYNLSVIKMKGVDKVYIRDKRTKTYINLSNWNGRRDFYEKKYGVLPSLAPKL